MVDQTARPAPRRIDEVADLVTPMAVRVAATLRLVEHVEDGARTVPELAARAQVRPGALAALVAHLVSVEVFGYAPDGGLVVDRLGRQLRVARPFLDAESTVGRAELSLMRLADSVRTGAAAYPLVFGASFWADLAAHPAMKASFDDMTDRHLDTEFDPLLAGYDWAAARHVADLGAGNGELLARLLRRYPRLRGTLVDLPGSLPAARRNLDRAGVGERCALVGGDFFAPLTFLPAATLVLSSVLHDWDDTETGAILRRCGEALHPGECVLVVDSFTDETTVDTRMDLRMLALFGGRQRSLQDMAAIADGAGVPVVRSLRLRKKWLLELRPRAA